MFWLANYLTIKNRSLLKTCHYKLNTVRCIHFQGIFLDLFGKYIISYFSLLSNFTSFYFLCKLIIFSTFFFFFFCIYFVSLGGGGLVTNLCPTLGMPWTIACQAPLFMGFSRQEYWSGLPFPSLLTTLKWWSQPSTQELGSLC